MKRRKWREEKGVLSAVFSDREACLEEEAEKKAAGKCSKEFASITVLAAAHEGEVTDGHCMLESWGCIKAAGVFFSFQAKNKCSLSGSSQADCTKIVLTTLWMMLRAHFLVILAPGTALTACNPSTSEKGKSKEAVFEAVQL